MHYINIAQQGIETNYAVNKMKRNQEFKPDADARLMDQVKEVLRYCRYAYRDGTNLLVWIMRYLKSVG